MFDSAFEVVQLAEPAFFLSLTFPQLCSQLCQNLFAFPRPELVGPLPFSQVKKLPFICSFVSPEFICNLVRGLEFLGQFYNLMLLSLLLGLYSMKVLVEVVKLAFLVSELVFKHYIFIPAVTVFTLQFSEGFF